MCSKYVQHIFKYLKHMYGRYETHVNITERVSYHVLIYVYKIEMLFNAEYPYRYPIS